MVKQASDATSSWLYTVLMMNIIDDDDDESDYFLDG